MRCAHCSFDNVPGVTTCQVCANPLAGQACSRCGFHNPPDYRFCGGCGQSLEEAEPEPKRRVTETLRRVAPPPVQGAEPGPETKRAGRSEPPPPILLVGFGAILALASVAFPWYLFGDSEGSAEQSLAQILESGWEWFPGVPLALIAICTLSTTFIAILGDAQVSVVRLSARTRPALAVALGIVTLFSATWLWLGYQSPESENISTSVAPATGAMLAAVGAIVLIGTGLWMYQALRSRSDKPDAE